MPKFFNDECMDNTAKCKFSAKETRAALTRYRYVYNHSAHAINLLYYFQFENLISCQPQLYFTLNKDLETDEWLLSLQINVVSSAKYWTHLKGECFRKTGNNSSQKIRGIIFCNFNNLCQPVSVHVGFIITIIRYLLSFISCNSVSKQMNMQKDVFYSFFE